MVKVLSKEIFSPTREQRRAIHEAAEQRGIDPATRDDTSMYEALAQLRLAWEAARPQHELPVLLIQAKPARTNRQPKHRARRRAKHRPNQARS